MKINKVAVLVSVFLLGGCSSIYDKISECQQKTGADADTCSQIVRQQQQANAQAWKEISDQLYRQQLATQ